MKYYVVADPHGFFTLMTDALREKGYFDNPEPHQLIILGDLMDRGFEAVRMQDWVLEGMKKEEIILIRGNHEDLMEDMIDRFRNYRMDILAGRCHHLSNGTFDTALQLTGYSYEEALYDFVGFTRKVKSSPFFSGILPRSRDYFETGKYVFVHGWVPNLPYMNEQDWRQASDENWREARWVNGMEAAGIHRRSLGEKIVVCGHFHTSWGHANLHRQGSEFGPDATFAPFYGNGVIGMDACTAFSRTVNCIVLEDTQK